MKISLLIKRIANIAGGAERVVVNVANQLAERGHAVEILTFEATSGSPFYPLHHSVDHRNLGISIQAGPTIMERRKPALASWCNKRSANPLLARISWRLTYQADIRRLRTHLEHHPRDLLVSFLPNTFNITARVAQELGIPYILSCHNVPERDFESSDRWDQNPFEKRMRLGSFKRATAITVILDEFRDWFPPDIRKKVHTIRNFINRPHAPLTPYLLRPLTVVAVGRYSAAKDHEVLLRAWQLIQPEFPAWRLEIYGDGPLKKSLHSLIEKLGIQHTAALRPPTSEIWEIYGNSQIFCIPSKFEGFGLVTAEAMACGTPSVGFKSCPGTNRIIKDGQVGILVDCEDRQKVEALAKNLARLMADPSLRETFSNQSFAEAEEDFVEHRIQDWFNLIDSIQGQKPSA